MHQGSMFRVGEMWDTGENRQQGPLVSGKKTNEVISWDPHFESGRA